MNKPARDIVVIGAGMTGLASAWYLVQAGAAVTVLEREEEPGGLCRSREFLPGVRWDRFYHVILSTDHVLLSFLDEMGLSPEVAFRDTRTGFYADGRLHSLSSVRDFLRFPPLSLWNRLRLGAGILYASRVSDWRRLERKVARAWLVRVCGRRNYERLWEPLLRSKFGSAADLASASFIWACIRRYYGTRHHMDRRERMGCVRGGYHSVLRCVADTLAARGVKIITGCQVSRLEPQPDGRVRVSCADGSVRDADQVLATIPNPAVLKLWERPPEDWRQRLAGVQYLSILCVTLVLRRSLTPYYVTNLTDGDLPFTGLIEATHIMPPGTFGSRTLVYLPRYMPAGDPYAAMGDEEVIAAFLQALCGMFPALTADDVVARFVDREPYVQPIQCVDYSRGLPPMSTPMPNVFMANTSMIVNSTLNNNEAVRLARDAAGHVMASGSAAARGAPAP